MLLLSLAELEGACDTYIRSGQELYCLRGKYCSIGKAAQCRQKVCSSKRPPKLEPGSVRANEVFENLACRVAPETQRTGQGRSVREKSVRANDPIQIKKIKGAFSLNNSLVGTPRPPDQLIRSTVTYVIFCAFLRN